MQVAELLRTAKDSLSLSVAFLSRLESDTQHLEVVESSIPLLFREGAVLERETSFCQAIIDGRIPDVIGDVGEHPVARELPAARFPRIRSYVSVPVTLSDGSLYGTFCAAGLRPNTTLGSQDRALLKLLAQAVALLIEPEVRARELSGEVQDRVDAIFVAGGPTIVLQPIVNLATGERTGSEALSRFPIEWGFAPDAIFNQAKKIGRGVELELLAIGNALENLDQASGYVGVNVSPTTVMDERFRYLMSRTDLPRVLLELSEQEPVEDYELLARALDPLRANGMRLAVDDVGSGFASLRHVVRTRPDVIKLDRDVVTNVSHDPALRALVRSITEFGHQLGAVIVAEGIEDSHDARVLRECDVDYGQGYFFGAGLAPEELQDWYSVGPHLVAVPANSADRG